MMIFTYSRKSGMQPVDQWDLKRLGKRRFYIASPDGDAVVDIHVRRPTPKRRQRQDKHFAILDEVSQ